MTQEFFNNYSRTGDVAVVALSLVVLILLTTSYVSRNHGYRLFRCIVALLVCAALININCMASLKGSAALKESPMYPFKIIYHALLFAVFFLFARYAAVVSGMEPQKVKLVTVIAAILAVETVIHETILTIDNTVATGTYVFMGGYILYILFMAVLMVRVRRRLFKRVMYGFFGTMGVSVLIQVLQMLQRHSSLTTMTFVFPVIAMLYIMHSNPYNVTLGSVDAHALEDLVRDMNERKEKFIFMSLYLPEQDAEGKELPEEVRAAIRESSGVYFRNAVLFQVGNGHMFLLVPKRRNPDWERSVQRLLDAFDKRYKHFRQSYKIVIGETIEEISRKNEYVSLIRSIHRSIPDSTVHKVDQLDIVRFDRDEYILRELADICSKQDMEDPRVLAYCQPVFNLRTGEFDTAEALMRLDLPETGLLFPGQFISIAENQGFIHVLTEIILHKTCREIRKLTEEGYRISRISVNVSVLELKDQDFCGDIRRIIQDNAVTGEQVAIELTESRSEADFMIMKEKIEELHSQGIKFYLDDFGTGYSNMERIMELPFDIIKFDRSMVVASGTGERSERIVENLAHMFSDMEYSVLYEGVESDADEGRCREMSASYLQGYKYSKPVPMEKLRDFLSKVG